ncbi:MAG: NAD-dependent epimerase/dehydratase family protein [Armatimonadia bacterium]|nr:NAD-dependent epimerase/dehydratase family protein [Armatimonadia bacterium]
MSEQLNVLIIGGSGFVSGTLARTARDAGHSVWTVTRGEKPIPEGVTSLIADRKDGAAFADAIADAGVEWDLAVDCIGYQPEDAQQDLEVLSPVVEHLVFISTDFVFDPAKRAFPQPFINPHFLTGEGYGPGKRACEEVLLSSDTDMRWTVLRPCHIYGPGSQLGCLPEHGRDADLIDRMRAGEALRLVGGGHFLQQPIFARDLAELALSVHGCDLADEQIYCSVGPDIIESVRYYEIIAKVLGVDLRVEEVSVAQTRENHPEWASFLCHRIYDLTPLRLAGLKVPNTPITEGLREHVESLM